MKIAVLYICTGKYSIFWKSFYESAQRFFLTDCEKHYFVFTDHNLQIVDTDSVHIQYESPKGFPLDSLLRYDMFLSIKDKLLKMDYIYFFNSNMQFVRSVGKEILPNHIDSGLVAVIHPGNYKKNKKHYPYERNLKSTAYIKYNKLESYNYYMGGVNGGKTKDYINLIENCSANISVDIKNGITAVYHDESHLNHYLHNKDILTLSPEYGYPEGSNLPFSPKIIILNKMKHGGKYFDKLPIRSYCLRLTLKLKRFYNSFIWRYQ
jgi:hypothetical protein